METTHQYIDRLTRLESALVAGTAAFVGLVMIDTRIHTRYANDILPELSRVAWLNDIRSMKQKALHRI